MKLSEEQLRRAALLAQQRQQYQAWNARPGARISFPPLLNKPCSN